MTASVAESAGGAGAPAARPPAHVSGTPRINPETGLSTDYLNHFAEAIMLLEIVAATPECADDLRAWRPRTYCEHFAASGFRDRDAVIGAYAVADPAAVATLERTVETIDAVLSQARDVVIAHLGTPAAEVLAQRAVGWLKPLVARAAAAIDGRADLTTPAIGADAAIDAMFAP